MANIQFIALSSSSLYFTKGSTSVIFLLQAMAMFEMTENCLRIVKIVFLQEYSACYCKYVLCIFRKVHD